MWVLMVVLAYSFGSGWTALSNIREDVFYVFADARGLGMVHMLSIAIVAALDLVCFWTILSPRAIGFRLVLADVALSWLVGVLQYSVAIAAPEGFRDACVTAAEIKGVTITPEEMEMFTSTWLAVGTISIVTVVAIFLAYLTVRHREYFRDPEPREEVTRDEE